MTKPFDRKRIEETWQPLDWALPQPLGGEAERYADYYGIRFANEFPGLLHGFGYFDAAEHRIAVHAWVPGSPRGTVMVAHGYFDHVGLYRHVIRHLLELKYAVLAYDLPGHGLSSGPRAAIDDFLIYRDVLHQVLENKRNGFPKPWHAIGQSTGAAIIMDYLLGNSANPETSPFDKIILLAPLVRPAAWRSAAILHSLASPFTDYVKRSFTINSSDSEFLHFLQNLDPLQHRGISARWVSALKKWMPGFERAAPIKISPVVIQGDRDGTVDWRYNLGVISDKFADPDIHIIKGARHQLANESEEFRLRVNRIIDQHLAG